MELTRRGFLRLAALSGLLPAPAVLLRAAEEAARRGEGKSLVVVQLSGGNDGLNTVVPFEDDAYHRSRPSLRIAPRSVLRLEAKEGAPVGFHPGLEPLHRLYKEGRVAVVQGVGYPNPSRSHFRSMDIWHSARPDVEEPRDGWLGRALGTRPSLKAFHIGDETLPLALAGPKSVPTLKNLDFLEFLARGSGRRLRAMLKALQSDPRPGAAERVRELGLGTLEEVDRLLELTSKAPPREYPPTPLAQRLRWAAQLIAGGHPARVYYLSQGGYDTHAQQADQHARLLTQLAEALHAFQKHLEAERAADRVAVLVFSEFGRRVRENGSLGTDHGVAAPLFVVSARCKGGVLGAHPSLTDLDQGDLKFHTDFRRIYAALLDDVLEVPHEKVLGRRFKKLELF